MTSAELVRNGNEEAARLVVLSKISSDDKWLENAVIALYRKQTEEERSAEQTIEDNGRGFNGLDAPFLTQMAEQIIAWRAETVHRWQRPLSPKQYQACRRMLRKYARQLVKIARKEV